MALDLSVVSGLRRIAGTGATLAGIDGGPWLLAEAGLLDGHPATTHWEDLENFATRFPNVDVRPDRFTVSDGRLTSGGYSVAFGKSIGMGYVTPDLAVPGTKLKVKMFDQLWDAVITEDSPYDPKNEVIRKDG